MVNVLKFQTFMLSVLNQTVGFQGWNVKISNRVDTDQTASSEAA